MKTKIVLLATLLILFVGCSKNREEAIITQNTDGNYVGTFERNGTSSNVQLNLNNGTFKGQSTTQKFPALCDGTYLIVGNVITFESKCMWTADFDWSLILNEEWKYIKKDNVLTLIKANGDKYILTQQ